MLENNQKEIILLEDLGMLYFSEKSKNKYRYGIYKCHCGNKFKAPSYAIQAGKTKSCGCIRKNKLKSLFKTHGLSRHRLYGTWKMMIARCYNTKQTKYNLYGGRGITVCDRWHSVANFIEDMYPSFKDGLTLDRKNPNGNYEKDNCRWANQTTQCRNTICIPSHNTSGIVGVYFSKKNKKWIANICIENKTKYIGSFISLQEANDARNTYIVANNLDHTIRV